MGKPAGRLLHRKNPSYVSLPSPLLAFLAPHSHGSRTLHARAISRPERARSPFFEDKTVSTGGSRGSREEKKTPWQFDLCSLCFLLFKELD